MEPHCSVSTLLDLFPGSRTSKSSQHLPTKCCSVFETLSLPGTTPKNLPSLRTSRRQRNSHSTFQLAYTILTIRTGRRPVRDNPFSLGPQSFGCFGRSVPVVSGGSQSFLWDLNSFSEHWSIYFWISELSNHNNKKERNERFVQNKQGHKSLMNAFSPVWWVVIHCKVRRDRSHQTSECQTRAGQIWSKKHLQVKFDQNVDLSTTFSHKWLKFSFLVID